MRYRSRPLFPSWLAMLVIAVLLVFAPIASAQSATSTGKASVEIVASPPTAQTTPDNYTIHRDRIAARFDPSLKMAQSGGTVSPWSGAFFYDVRGATFNAVVLNKITDLTKNSKLAGFGLYGFAGTTVDKAGKAVAGIAIGKDWKWFDQISFFTGVGISFSASQPIGGGIIVGASIHF